MSTHIDNAWLIRTDKLHALTKIGQRVAAIHRADIVQQCVTRLLEFSWVDVPLREVSDIPPDMLTPAFGDLRRIVQRFDHHMSWTLPDEGQKLLEKRIQGMNLSTDQGKSLLYILKEIYEVVSQHTGAAVTFLPGDNGATLMAGFALADKAVQWCDTHFRDMHFQDSTDEPLRSFNPALDKFVSDWIADREECDIDKENVKVMLSAYEQQQRGKRWDEAFKGKTTFAEAGLSHRCYTNGFGPGEVALLVCRKLFKAKE